MPADDVKKVIGRMLSDHTFLSHFTSDPDAALSHYNLTANEVKAIKAIDMSKINSLHVDMSRDIEAGAMKVGALYLS